ncbi:hypothetical protein CRENBAI_026253 [Crenichthys baileyi]|uniref:Uncharacterized protein n=1 Tax=Crenichthys baileyi TaxID=28760 RepID=A0AAV9RL18_9TELE
MAEVFGGSGLVLASPGYKPNQRSSTFVSSAPVPSSSRRRRCRHRDAPVPVPEGCAIASPPLPEGLVTASLCSPASPASFLASSLQLDPVQLTPAHPVERPHDASALTSAEGRLPTSASVSTEGRLQAPDSAAAHSDASASVSAEGRLLLPSSNQRRCLPSKQAAASAKQPMPAVSRDELSAYAAKLLCPPDQIMEATRRGRILAGLLSSLMDSNGSPWRMLDVLNQLKDWLERWGDYFPGPLTMGVIECYCQETLKKIESPKPEPAAVSSEPQYAAEFSRPQLVATSPEFLEGSKYGQPLIQVPEGSEDGQPLIQVPEGFEGGPPLIQVPEFPEGADRLRSRADLYALRPTSRSPAPMVLYALRPTSRSLAPRVLYASRPTSRSSVPRVLYAPRQTTGPPAQSPQVAETPALPPASCQATSWVLRVTSSTA